jgi:hypothetical protein
MYENKFGWEWDVDFFMALSDTLTRMVILLAWAHIMGERKLRLVVVSDRCRAGGSTDLQ